MSLFISAGGRVTDIDRKFVVVIFMKEREEKVSD